MLHLTWLASRQNVLGDGDSVLRAAGPVHHAPPALHREADVCVTRHWTLMDAQNCNIEMETTEMSLIQYSHSVSLYLQFYF